MHLWRERKEETRVKKHKTERQRELLAQTHYSRFFLDACIILNLGYCAPRLSANQSIHQSPKTHRVSLLLLSKYPSIPSTFTQSRRGRLRHCSEFRCGCATASPQASPISTQRRATWLADFPGRNPAIISTVSRCLAFMRSSSELVNGTSYTPEAGAPQRAEARRYAVFVFCAWTTGESTSARRNRNPNVTSCLRCIIAFWRARCRKYSSAHAVWLSNNERRGHGKKKRKVGCYRSRNSRSSSAATLESSSSSILTKRGLRPIPRSCTARRQRSLQSCPAVVPSACRVAIDTTAE